MLEQRMKTAEVITEYDDKMETTFFSNIYMYMINMITRTSVIIMTKVTSVFCSVPADSILSNQLSRHIYIIFQHLYLIVASARYSYTKFDWGNA